MILDQQVLVRAPLDQVWDFLMDVPAVSSCLPGLESLEVLSDDSFAGALRVRVGPIALRLEGKLTVVERDRDRWLARMDVEAVDPVIRGSVTARSTMQLRGLGDGTTELTIHTDAAVLGKLGEFGQPIMQRKADQIVGQFVENLAEQVRST